MKPKIDPALVPLVSVQVDLTQKITDWLRVIRAGKCPNCAKLEKRIRELQRFSDSQEECLKRMDEGHL